jgi:excisionase family DNA binding protein
VAEQSRGRDLPRTLTASEAAAIIGVSVATVRGWADQGVLPSYRTAGRHRRFEVEELKRWLTERGAAVPTRISRPRPAGRDLPPCPALAREMNARTERIVDRLASWYAEDVPTWGAPPTEAAMRRSAVRFLRIATAALETGSVARSVGRAEVAGMRGGMQGDRGAQVILEFSRLAAAMVLEADDAVRTGVITDEGAMPALLAVCDHVLAAALNGVRAAPPGPTPD